jgi:polysaccharide biosynthesis protein PslH
MKILQVCNKPPYPPHDGGSLAMYNLARSLSNQGHELTVLTMETSKHKLTGKQKADVAKLMRFIIVPVDTGTHLPDLLKNLIFSRQPYNAQRFVSCGFEDALIRMLKAEAFDIVQLEGPYLATYIPVIRAHSKALVALRAHNIEHEIWYRLVKSIRNPVKKLYFTILANRIRNFESSIINQYDLLVPITQRDLDVFNKMGNQRPAIVCQAGIEAEPSLEKFRKENKFSFRSDHMPSLFFLGSLEWIPNQEGLLWFTSEVLPLLKRRYPQLRLHVAGRNAPENLVKKISLPEIIYHGTVDDSREFIKSHDVMVVPCFSGSGMRLKIIEAMAMSKLVITTPIGAEGIAVEPGKNILIARDAEEFFQHIESVMKHPDLCSKIGQQAWEFVSQNFDNNNLAKNLAEFYKAQLT